jgi:hypothetical protein
MFVVPFLAVEALVVAWKSAAIVGMWALLAKAVTLFAPDTEAVIWRGHATMPGQEARSQTASLLQRHLGYPVRPQIVSPATKATAVPQLAFSGHL